MAEKQLTLQTGEVVKKSNALARCRWQTESTWEPKIVALVASKVHIADEDFHTYRIPVAELTGHSDENLSGAQYQEIAKSIERLSKSTVRIQGTKPRNFLIYPIFAKCGYENGDLIAGFHPDLKPHYLNLQGKFVQIGLVDFLMLTSAYSQRIFEILKSWDDKPEIKIALAELHDILGTPESLRQNFAHFRRRVLEQAHKDINGKTRFSFDWEPVTGGKSRAVTAIRFIFSGKRRAEARALASKKTQDKQSAANNKVFFTANECFEKKGGVCRKPVNKPKVCAFCREYILPRVKS
jgi:plasmid replication initiation protein